MSAPITPEPEQPAPRFRELSASRVFRDLAKRTAENLPNVRLQLEHEQKMAERGWIGRIIGAGDEKQGNVAFILLGMFVVLFALVLFFYVDAPTITRKEALAIVGGFITLTLGYVFGKSG